MEIPDSSPFNHLHAVPIDEDMHISRDVRDAVADALEQRDIAAALGSLLAGIMRLEREFIDSRDI
ncbi:hypothetical protein [Nocardia gipuzkoensis]|uniref:hypothetical protein n=1 Tax=Nocardia gipuzkoensis TaxID=2749991 RepID=UPI0015EEA70F|nr:hypothetical protein [Nocardia gipuzkoensis]